MWKFVIFGICAYLLYKMFTNDSRKKAKEAKKEKENLIATGEMTKDPICGTYVPINSDIRLREGDKVHCFCSYECRDRFVKQLEK